MRIDQVRARFQTLSSKGIVCYLNDGASLEAIAKIEREFDIQFPNDVAQFWGAINGLQVTDPQLSLFPLSNMSLDDQLLVFGSCDGSTRLAFDISRLNVADRWSIINADTGYRITLSMASFWSTHMWTWIVKRKPIWFNLHV